MKTEQYEPGLEQVLAALGLSEDSFLGKGSEAWVYALDRDRAVRISRGGVSRAQLDGRSRLLVELNQSADGVPFEIPAVLEVLEIGGLYVTIEKRLPGRQLDQALAGKEGEARQDLVRAYLDTAARIGDLVLNRPWFGDLAAYDPVRKVSFREYLEQKAARSLNAAGPDFAAVDPAKLAAALPEPENAALVHLDAFPGNMLADEEGVTAVLDFGPAAIMGDRRLDPLSAAIYLDRAITPAATPVDRATAREWLKENNLLALFWATRNWLAAYWSFALDDVDLYQWCRKVLLQDHDIVL